jgi:hypothetical protein
MPRTTPHRARLDPNMQAVLSVGRGWRGADRLAVPCGRCVAQSAAEHHAQVPCRTARLVLRALPLRGRQPWPPVRADQHDMAALRFVTPRVAGIFATAELSPARPPAPLSTGFGCGALASATASDEEPRACLLLGRHRAATLVVRPSKAHGGRPGEAIE